MPKRVPVRAGLTSEAGIAYAGKDIKTVHWRTAEFYDVMAYLGERLIVDSAPMKPHVMRNPYRYQVLGAKTIVMNKEGYVQHPEVHGLEPEEYPDFIADPHRCILETILPRLYEGLNQSPVQNALNLTKAYKVYKDQAMALGADYAKIIDRFGYAKSVPGGFTEAPLDYVADFIRSFSGVSKDMRRHPQELMDAAEAVLPILINQGLGPVRTIDARVFMPLHMAPFMNTKQFEKFYWPTFKKIVEAFYAAGMGVDLFVEQDWMRYLDYLKELPGPIVMRFEYGDPKIIKEKLGDKHIVSGLYPISILKTESKQACIDKAKELVDILAPGGGYIFDIDKEVLSLGSVNMDNLIAVTNFVREYGVY
ncbi:MAG: uroporphyrinogen decarboxylase family protein [Eubacterium sp.]|nr:uroporphyrinogen decarboxylase family protein [Eubacterium sp.]